jgi:hypothetical protein
MIVNYLNKQENIKIICKNIHINSTKSFQIFKSIGFFKKNLKFIINCSYEMKFEKKVIDYLHNFNVEIFLIFDEIYNVKGRWKQLGSSIKKVSNILYLEGTKKNEIYNMKKEIFFIHPILDKYYLKDNIINFNYKFNSKAPLLIIDEYKEEYFLLGSKKKFNGFFFELIANNILKNSKIIKKPHPKYSRQIYDKKIIYISGVLGYSSMFLINNLWSDIPFFSVSKNQNNSYSLLKPNNIKKISVKEIKTKTVFRKKKKQKIYSRSKVIYDIAKKLNIIKK